MRIVLAGGGAPGDFWPFMKLADECAPDRVRAA